MDYVVFIMVITALNSVPLWVYITATRVRALTAHRSALTWVSAGAAVAASAGLAHLGGLGVASEVSYTAMVVVATVMGVRWAQSR